MRVDMVGAILRVVLDYENRRVVPVRTVGDRLGDTSHGKIVVGYRRIWRRRAGLCAGGVVVGQTHQAKVRKLGAMTCFPGLYESCKLPQKFIGPELVRIFDS